uniref:Uncharacterized protein n=1 Tax=Oryza barthii TaxID=65489 RepID=A0A0D3F363_9ORYZ
MMGYASSTQSYGEPCSYGGGSSTAQHEIGPSQIDEPPPITQPTQDYRHVDVSGVEVARLSASDIYLKDYLCQDADLQLVLEEGKEKGH